MKVGTNRKPVCDFLLVINSNWHPILYRFGVIAAYCVNFDTAFLSHPTPFAGLGATYYMIILGSLEIAYWTYY